MKPVIKLPVTAVLDTLKQRLSERDEVVLQAPPGAGKTTLVPLALLEAPWLRGKKILLLEPRRIAARAAAYRMADLLNETPGQRVGYRMRLDTNVSQQTRIEVITEGILIRMLQHDPSLETVGLVIFDEFHERNLDADLALSLCLKGRALFRDSAAGEPALKILVMSATLDSTAIAGLLNDAPVVSSAGRAYPVEVIYGRASQPRERIIDRVVSTVQQALSHHPESSILVFLPGQGEIRRATDALAQWLVERKISGVQLRPLFGHLSIAEQQQAIAPLAGAEAGEQKVVLATNIAETSLTIEGIDVVVDAGWVREARFNPATGMTGLHTVKISAASSEQRAGRAGRLRPGTCYRLWSASQQQQLAAHSDPEILHADLAPLALQLLQWGVADPAELRWLDAPPRGPWQQALALLEALGAITEAPGGRMLTAHGQALVKLPVHPRLGQLLLRGADAGCVKTAVHLASLLTEHDPFSRDQPDLSQRLAILAGRQGCPPAQRGWLHRTQPLARQLAEQMARFTKSQPVQPTQAVAHLLQREQRVGYLLACAYPDRIARRRHAGGYQLSNGRSANFFDKHPLGQQPWLAIAEISSMAGGKGDIIRSAAALDAGLFTTWLSDQVTLDTLAQWDKQAQRFRAEAQQKIGALVLKRTALRDVPVEAKRAALIEHIRREGLQLLPWRPELQQWCARVNLLRATEGAAAWPEVSEAVLLANLEQWLAPYLDAVNRLPDFKKLDLAAILSGMLSWEQQQALQRLAPLRLKVPSGSVMAIDYSVTPPVLAVKLQEMFGCEQTPAVVNGKVPLLIHLLSPAGRPLQVTQDLAGFWRSSYFAVKKDMKGRYPKHPWPDNPLIALPTRRTKARQ